MAIVLLILLEGALSTFIVLPGNIYVGNHPLVTRFMRGVFQSRPTFPKYTEIWDVNVVLSHLKILSPVAKLSLQGHCKVLCCNSTIY